MSARNGASAAVAGRIVQELPGIRPRYRLARADGAMAEVAAERDRRLHALNRLAGAAHAERKRAPS